MYGILRHFVQPLISEPYALSHPLFLRFFVNAPLIGIGKGSFLLLLFSAEKLSGKAVYGILDDLGGRIDTLVKGSFLFRKGFGIHILKDLLQARESQRLVSLKQCISARKVPQDGLYRQILGIHLQIFRVLTAFLF